MAESLSISPDDLTIGDIEDVEGYVGKPIAEIFPDGDDDTPTPISGKALVALVWVIKRREDPAFTLADARQLKVAELQLEGGEERPTDAAG